MTTLAEDTFTRADSGTLGANWTKLSTYADIAIVSNAAVGPGASDVYTAADPLGVDHWAQCTHNAVDGGGPIVRSDLTDTFYLFNYNTTSNMDVYRHDSGGYTFLNRVVGVVPVSGDLVYMEVQGTTIKTFQNGTLRNNFTDLALDGVTTGGPRAGLLVDGCICDDFAMGDFATFIPVHRRNLLGLGV